MAAPPIPPTIAPISIGPTSSRPISPPVGWVYSDTTLNVKIQWDGYDWVEDDGTIVSTFDYYVDSVNGNDFNDGKTSRTAFATLSAAITAVGSASNKSVGLARGGVWRATQMTFAGTGTSVRAYGSASSANPQILGSNRISGSWSVVSGTIYATPLAYTPRNVFWQNSSTGVITKLFPGTAGALTSNQWAVTGGNLQVNIGIDPTGQYIEVPINVAWNNPSDLGVGLLPTGSSHTYRNLNFSFWPGSGASFVSIPNIKLLDSVISWNGNDGVDFHGVGSSNFLVSGNTIQSNGYTRGDLSGGPGDGISCHTLSSGTITQNSLIDNARTGIGNQADVTVVSTRNLLTGNYVDWRIYNDAESNPPGTHTAAYNLILRTATDETALTIDGNTNIALTAYIYNNTFVNTSSQATRAMAIATGTVLIENNVVDTTYTQGIGSYNAASGFGYAVTTSNYNQFGGTYKYQPGYPPDTQGANDNLGNPQIIAVSSGNYGLKATSPAYATGTPLGYSVDYYGNPVSSTTPSRGAVERL